MVSTIILLSLLDGDCSSLGPPFNHTTIWLEQNLSGTLLGTILAVLCWSHVHVPFNTDRSNRSRRVCLEAKGCRVIYPPANGVRRSITLTLALKAGLYSLPTIIQCNNPDWTWRLPLGRSNKCLLWRLELNSVKYWNVNGNLLCRSGHCWLDDVVVVRDGDGWIACHCAHFHQSTRPWPPKKVSLVMFWNIWKIKERREIETFSRGVCSVNENNTDRSGNKAELEQNGNGKAKCVERGNQR